METITIKGERVIDIYESFDGSYWFVTDKPGGRTASSAAGGTRTTRSFSAMCGCRLARSVPSGVTSPRVS